MSINVSSRTIFMAIALSLLWLVLFAAPVMPC